MVCLILVSRYVYYCIVGLLYYCFVCVFLLQAICALFACCLVCCGLVVFGIINSVVFGLLLCSVI